MIQKVDGTKIINGAAASAENTLRPIGNLEVIRGKTGSEARIPVIGPAEFLAVIGHPESKVKTWKSVKFAEDLDSVTVHVSALIPGNRIMRPGLKFKVEGGFMQKLDFVSLMLALFLGTVSGLIVAASGAVAHDLMDRYLGMNLSEERKVRAGKISAFAIGIVSIFLGIIFEGMNVSFLVGWAFSVAASANLPSIVMLLFWSRTTAEGIIASIVTGVISAMGLILLPPSMYKMYGLNPASAPVPIDNPGVFSIPLSFVALVVVSLLTGNKKKPAVSA